MKKAQLIHNPGSGDGKHDKNSLIAALRETGHDVHYASTKARNWEVSFLENADIIFVAGGDGTVQKVASVLLNRTPEERQVPLHVLPLGTANNIARSLGLYDLPMKELLQLETSQNLDYGKVTGVEAHRFFIESMGLGVFPKLISKMHHNIFHKLQSNKLKHVYKVLKKIIAGYKPKETVLQIDDKRISGNFLMVELMNIKLLGPNIEMAQNANPFDALLNLVLIPEDHKDQLIAYVDSLIDEAPANHIIPKIAKTYTAKKVSFLKVASTLHIDDDLVEDHQGGEIVAEVVPAAFKVITHKNPT